MSNVFTKYLPSQKIFELGYDGIQETFRDDFGPMRAEYS